MKVVDVSKSKSSAEIAAQQALARRKRLAGYGIVLTGLLIVFAVPLLNVVRLALKEDLHSHVLLIPFITAYLLYTAKDQLPKQHSTSWGGAVLLCLVGAGFLTDGFGYWGMSQLSAQTPLLSARILALVCFANAGGFVFMGSAWMRAAAFPMAFLLFATPLPDPVVHWLEHNLKLGSAAAAALMFDATALPYFREGMVFQIPGIVIEVADECSGIRSSYVLFITSTLASYLFIQSPWRRGVLAFTVIPLGIIRNGFRILVIAWMCVEMGPAMIHSFVHRRGGPLFFLLSLIPLAALLWALRRGERPPIDTNAPQ